MKKQFEIIQTKWQQAAKIKGSEKKQQLKVK